MNRVYSQEQLDYIKEVIESGAQYKEATDKFNAKFGTNKSTDSIKYIALRHDYGYHNRNHDYSRYSQEQLDFIKDGYIKGLSAPKITKEYNKKYGTHKSPDTIKNAARRYGLIDFDKCFYYSKAGNKIYRQEEGHYSKQAPIGTIFARKERDGYFPYILVSYNPRKLVRLTKYLWEKEHGEIPKGYTVVLCDKDPSNVNLDNLYLINRGVLFSITKNKLAWHDRESLEACIALASIYQTMKNKDLNFIRRRKRALKKEAKSGRIQSD